MRRLLYLCGDRCVPGPVQGGLRMKPYRSERVRLGLAAAVAAGLLVTGGRLSAQLPAQLPLEPPKDSGNSITPAYEGWYQNEDGTYNLLVGYFNRNFKEIIDIPIGPNNRIEPGGPDMGQPTHFLPRRQWGVFVIKVPADFGTKKYTWTIVANGKTQSIPLGLTKGYQVEPFKDAAMGNTPPALRFAPDGPKFIGPPLMEKAETRETEVGKPLTLTAWATDDGFQDPRFPPRPTAATLFWSKYRGEGDVTFEPPRPKIDQANGGKATTTATFSKPGEYVLRLQANDATGEGGGGFQCCWTNAYVKVTVK